jgi:hypothetical protein
LQKDHDLTDLFLVGPGLLDHLDSFCADSIRFVEALDSGFNDVEGFFPKHLDYPAGHYGTDAFDESRPQVLLDTVHGGWDKGPVGDNFELLAVPRMICPLVLHPDDFSRNGRHQTANHCDQVTSS